MAKSSNKKKEESKNEKPEPIINIDTFASNNDLTVTLLAGFKHFTNDNNVFRTLAEWDELYSEYLKS